MYQKKGIDPRQEEVPELVQLVIPRSKEEGGNGQIENEYSKGITL